MSTYSVVVALHIIAAFAAYGLPAAYPLLVPYVRRHHPAALPGVHAIQYRLNVALTGPFTVAAARRRHLPRDRRRPLGRAVRQRRASPRSRSSRVVGGGVIVPATKRLAELDPAGAEYDRVYRRYLTAEIFLGARRPARDLRNGGQAVLINGRVAPCRPALPSC